MSHAPDSVCAPAASVGASGHRLTMGLVLASDAMSFLALLAVYALLRAGDPDWPQSSELLDLRFAAGMTMLLLGSSFTMRRALRAIRAGEGSRGARHLMWTASLGGAFLLAQAIEWRHLCSEAVGMAPRADNFSACFFAITGFHGAHVLLGVVLLAIAAWMQRSADRGPDGMQFLENLGLYWHFVDGVWLVVFGLLYGLG